MNRLTREIGRACQELLLQEKWLVGPNNRIGWQWLENAARNGFGLVNLQPRTLRTMALDLAKEPMGREGLRYLDDRGAILLMERIRADLQDELLYFSSSMAGLSRLLHRALVDIRQAGLNPADLTSSGFEAGPKGRDLALIMKAYLEKLRHHKLLDYPGVIDLAVAEVERDRSLFENRWILLPDFLDLGYQERRLVDALSLDRVVKLRADRPVRVDWEEESGEKEPQTDLELLRWIDHPAAAPASLKDGSVNIIRTVGEVNEVRGVMRTCLAEGIPLDTVELLYTDNTVYLPLIYETLTKIKALEEAADELPPATFAEGVPGIFSRPCRALAGWIAWIRDDFSQKHLTRLIREGLLKRPETGPSSPGFANLAENLFTLNIGTGRERYLPRIKSEFEKTAELRTKATQEEDDREKKKRQALQKRRKEELAALKEMVEALLEVTPARDAPVLEILAKAALFVERICRTVNELDNNARLKLAAEIKDLMNWIQTAEAFPEGDIWDWLAELPERIHLLGSGPRPGRIHVAPALSGGHSGRSRTFIVGLDDSRFPGAGLQDPILLDSERAGLSDRLNTAAGDLSRKKDLLGLLLARLRGRLTLSYPCFNLTRDAEMFPSGIILSAFRLLSGIRDGDHTRLAQWLDPPLTFAPESLEECLDESEYWLLRFCGPKKVGNRPQLAKAAFPHLGRGALAEEMRRSPVFGSYDGLVPESGRDPRTDPFGEEGPVMSAGRLERIGRCPLGYFFRYVLELKPEEEPVTDPEDWLGPLKRGSILHRAFQVFMEGLIKEELLPEFDRDIEKLEKIVDGLVEMEENQSPPPDPEIPARRKKELRRIAAVFLKEEEEFCRTSRPVYLEADIGFGRESSGNPLETSGPVKLKLPSGRRIKVRGRLDRIDLKRGSKERIYSVWDYKTGWAGRYDKVEPFSKGRIIQHFIYLALARAALKKIDPDAAVERFGYVFTSLAARGERLEWTGEELNQGAGIVEELCRLVSQGTFPATDNKGDCAYCDFRDICGDPEETAHNAAAKLNDPENRSLEPFRSLRRDEDE